MEAESIGQYQIPLRGVFRCGSRRAPRLPTSAYPESDKATYGDQCLRIGLIGAGPELANQGFMAVSHIDTRDVVISVVSSLHFRG